MTSAGSGSVPDRDALAERVRGLLRDVPDFPQPGVLFKDFSPLLADAPAFAALVADVARHWDGQVDLVAGIEARGFVLGAAVAHALGVGFVPVRKAGKLPPPVRSLAYDLEYGSATLEVAEGAVRDGQRVLVLDDVLATGGTARAACELLEQDGARVVAVEVVLELTFLPGRDALGEREVRALLTA